MQVQTPRGLQLPEAHPQSGEVLFGGSNPPRHLCAQDLVFPTRLGMPHREGWGRPLISLPPQGWYLGGAPWRLLEPNTTALERTV